MGCWLPSEEQYDRPAHTSFKNGLVNAGFVILGGPLSDEHRVVLAIEADSEGTAHKTFARGLWSEAYLILKSVDELILRVDGHAERLG